MTSAFDKTLTVPRIAPAHLLDGHLSIVVYGPGAGEAILVRLPDGRVGVVDGCRSDNDPVLELVRALGPKRLAFVCMTHPHEDHFKGLDVILAAYREQIDNVWETGAVIARNYDAWVEWMRLTGSRGGLLDDTEMDALCERLGEPLSRIYAEMGTQPCEPTARTRSYVQPGG